MEQQIEVPAEWDSVEHLMVFADSAERFLQLSTEQGFLLRLVVEEIATNIIKYSYPAGVRGVIQLACACYNRQLQVIIRDKGRPFDPRDHPLPSLDGDVTTRSIGGLGILLVREFADHIDYRHDPTSGWNELVVLKGAH